MKDDEFLRAFEDRTLPFEQWTHRSHVKVAYLYLRQYPFDEALNRLRASILAYNAANHRPEGPSQGYNETTTHALLHLIAAVMQAYAQSHPAGTADEFCDLHPQLLSKHVLRLFYSPARRTHPLAKMRFIEPDLAPLPRIVSSDKPADWLAIRPAKLSDIPAMARVHVDSWRTTYRGIVPDEFLAGLNTAEKEKRFHKYFHLPRTIHLVAEFESAGIVGFINGGPNRTEGLPFDAEIYALYLLKQCQRHGVGTAMVAGLAGWLRDQGHRSMLAWVLEQNSSCGFYERLGGKQTGQQPITIGGATLQEIAYGWDSLNSVADALA